MSFLYLPTYSNAEAAAYRPSRRRRRNVNGVCGVSSSFWPWRVEMLMEALEGVRCHRQAKYASACVALGEEENRKWRRNEAKIGGSRHCVFSSCPGGIILAWSARPLRR